MNKTQTNMVNKKILFCLILLNFLGACTTPTAMLAPVYTLSTSGNIYQAGISYGSNEVITIYTGKTPIENLKEISKTDTEKEKNIQTKTLESEEFYFLVKNKIKKTNSVIDFFNQ